MYKLLNRVPNFPLKILTFLHTFLGISVPPSSRRRRTTTFEAYNQTYADTNTISPMGAECSFTTFVYPKDNLKTGCAICEPNRFQCPHGLFCFSFADYSNYRDYCRYCMIFCLSVSLSEYLYLSINLSIYLSICLSIYLPISLSLIDMRGRI